MSPVVRRLADIQGGWAKVVDSSSGGSAFQVFLPDAGSRPAVAEPPPVDDDLSPTLQIVVDEVAPAPAARPTPEVEEPWEAASAEQILSQELRRLAELSGDERKGRGR